MIIKSEVLSNSDHENEEGICEKGTAVLGSVMTENSETDLVRVKNEPIDQDYESNFNSVASLSPAHKATTEEENRSLYVTYSPPRMSNGAQTPNGDSGSQRGDQANSAGVTGSGTLNSVIDTLSLRQELQVSQSELSQQHLENGRLQRDLADCQREMAELKDQLSTRETQIANLANNFFDLSNQFMRVAHEFKRISQTLPQQGSHPRLQNGFV